MDIQTDGAPRAAVQTFTWTRTESVNEAIVRAVSAVLGYDPTEMDPLYDAIDPDSLRSLVDSTDPSESENDLSIEFPYQGVRVRVDAAGTGQIFLQTTDDHGA